MNLVKGIRPLDYVLTAAMVALAAALGVANAVAGTDADVAHPLDTHTVWLIPVFVLAALPILWRRRSILAAIGASFIVMAASVPNFGWVTRCGFVLPLSFAMAYAVARFAGGRQHHVVGLLGILALQVVSLVKDSSTGGVSAITLAAPIAAVFYAVGIYVEARAKAPATPTLAVERVHA